MLKNNGIAIIAVPQDFKLNIDILEDPNADPNPDHWRKFGSKFINLLDRFKKVDTVFDTSFDTIKQRLIEDNKQFTDLFVDIDTSSQSYPDCYGYTTEDINKKKPSYVDGQVFYICHK